MLKKVAVSSEKSLGSQRIGLEFFADGEEPDLVALKREFLRYTMANDLISAFGGTNLTRSEELVVVRHDSDLNFEVLVGPAEGIQHLQNDLIIKIRQVVPDGQGRGLVRHSSATFPVKTPAVVKVLEKETPVSAMVVTIPDSFDDGLDVGDVPAKTDSIAKKQFTSSPSKENNTEQVQGDRDRVNSCEPPDELNGNVTLESEDECEDIPANIFLLKDLPNLPAKLKEKMEKEGQRYSRSCINWFVREMAVHLSRHVKQANRTKALYNAFGEKLVDAFPVFRDKNHVPWATVKDKLTKCITNKTDQVKHGAQRLEAKRNEKVEEIRAKLTAPPEKEPEGGAGEAAGVEEDAEEKKARERKERERRHRTVKGLTLVQILEKVPEYRSIETIHTDFLNMDPMSSVGEVEFRSRFDDLVKNFSRFLGGEEDETLSDRGILELCLAINEKASTAQGVKGIPPLISFQQVGEEIVPADVLAMPHAIVILDGVKITSVMIVCCHGLAFKIAEISKVSNVFLILIGCYYAFDLHFFAAFGLLAIIDKYVLRPQKKMGAKKVRTKRGKSIKVPACLTEFMREFDAFLSAAPN